LRQALKPFLDSLRDGSDRRIDNAVALPRFTADLDIASRWLAILAKLPSRPV
jgi:hypothetical protein